MANVTEVDARYLKTDDVSELPSKGDVINPTTDIDSYKMDLPKRGRALVINNVHFHPESELGERTGSDVDARNLKRIFRKLGFEVAYYDDVTGFQLVDIIKDMARVDHINNDCFICAMLSHGDDGCIYGVDGRDIKIKKLVDEFRGDVCPSLAGKPKIFIFQSCRGNEYEIPVPSSGDVPDGPTVESYYKGQRILTLGGAAKPTIPSGSDFLFCYSVSEGFYSFRDSCFGSWYIQELTTAVEDMLLMRPDKNAKKHDFLDVLTVVNQRVSQKRIETSFADSADALGKKQMPCYLSMLTKKLFLSFKEK